jgi:hypothetical protein
MGIFSLSLRGSGLVDKSSESIGKNSLLNLLGEDSPAAAGEWGGDRLEATGENSGDGGSAKCGVTQGDNSSA